MAIDPWRRHWKGAIKGNSWQAKTSLATRPSHDVLEKVEETGVILRLDQTTAETGLEISTPRGTFHVSLAELSSGRPLGFLDGAVETQSIGNTQDLVATSDDEDFPSAATAADGTVYLAYIAFTPGPDFINPPVIKKEPKDFKEYAEPTGGDRVWLLMLNGSQWSKPIAVTDGGEDLYRTATAVDGQGRAWVFFSKNVDAGADLTGGDWELFARNYHSGKLGPLVRLTHEAGPDIYPAAATDAEGRVWVAWQAFRNGKAKILTARQEGNGFGQPLVVAEGAANHWCPAIAATASKPAEVTIAWDTYAKGDYDVYARTFHGDCGGRAFCRGRHAGFSRPGPRWPTTATADSGWLGSNRVQNWGKEYRR